MFFCEDSKDCSESYFLKSCTGCMNCFGCINLRNKQHHIFNEPYSKEEYAKKIKEFRLDTYSGLEKTKKQAWEFWLKHPYKYMHSSTQNVNCTGDYVFNAKNALDCYQARQLEDARYCQFISMPSAKDIYDLSEWGNGAELVVDALTVGEGARMVKFSSGAWHQNTTNVEYGMYNVSCGPAFGCINLRKKKYRVLNKQYSPEEYSKVRLQIIESMNNDPYTDSQGRVWRYGDFLPYDLSPFAYNESHAIQYFSLTKKEVLERGWRWREQTPSNHVITLPAEKIPDSIRDIDDAILKEILGCKTCGKAFRLIPAELALLRRFEFSIPRMCPDCRHTERLSRINPPRLWNRNCAKCCKNIQTSYSPNRPEIVYCEQCYQAEVA